MKASFVCLAVVAMAAMLSFGANAQEHHGPAGHHPNGFDSKKFDAEKFAQMKADHMREALNLDQKTYDKVLKVYQKEAKNFEKQQKFRKDQDAEFRKILTPEQYKAYKKAQHGRHGRHGQPGGHGNMNGADSHQHHDCNRGECYSKQPVQQADQNAAL